MREIVLDTETTGLDPLGGDRVVEIGAVELNNHVPTGRTYHQYINPQRDMPEEAFRIHGLSNEFLSDKPVFKAVATEFLDFVGTDKLVIHNAPFDMKFLNAELEGAGMARLAPDQAIDTAEMARRKFPGSPASLDALCRKFGIDNSARTLHGALLDSEILAEVYLELIGGRQPDFVLDASPAASEGNTVSADQSVAPRRQRALPPRITDEEKAAHAAFVDSLGDNALWPKSQA